MRGDAAERVLDRVDGGEVITIAVDGREVAELRLITPEGRWMKSAGLCPDAPVVRPRRALQQAPVQASHATTANDHSRSTADKSPFEPDQIGPRKPLEGGLRSQIGVGGGLEFCDHVESCEAKPEVRGESFVETPQLLHRESTDSSTESLNVDGAELRYQDQRRVALDLDRRSKRCWSSTPRRRSDDHDGPRQKLVRLHHDPQANPMLLVSEPLRDVEPKHLTPLHALTP